MGWLRWILVGVCVCVMGCGAGATTSDDNPGQGGSGGDSAGAKSQGGGGAAAAGRGGGGGGGQAGQSSHAGSAGKPPAPEHLSVWGSAADDVWVGNSDGTLLHYDGQDWSDPMPIAEGGRVTRLWGAAADHVFAVVDATVYHFDGDAWTDLEPPTERRPLSSVHGSAPDDVWVVGTAGQALHWDGSEWTDRSAKVPPGQRLEDIWVVSDGEAWAVDAAIGANLYHYLDGSWTSVTTDFESRAVYALGTDVWLGQCRKNASAWSCPSRNLPSVAVWGVGPSDVFAASARGLTHFDGQEWKDVASNANANNPIRDIWSDGETTWLVGPKLLESR
jgi:hypothetical protein